MELKKSGIKKDQLEYLFRLSFFLGFYGARSSAEAKKARTKNLVQTLLEYIRDI